jgi:hypothetical protein
VKAKAARAIVPTPASSLNVFMSLASRTFVWCFFLSRELSTHFVPCKRTKDHAGHSGGRPDQRAKKNPAGSLRRGFLVPCGAYAYIDP